MQIAVATNEVAGALIRQQPGEAMLFLAALALADTRSEIIGAISARHNGTPEHRAALPWLRRLVTALEVVEAADDAVDAAGRVG